MASLQLAESVGVELGCEAETRGNLRKQRAAGGKGFKRAGQELCLHKHGAGRCYSERGREGG